MQNLLAPISSQEDMELTQNFTAAHAEAPMQMPSGGDFHDAFPLPDGSGNIAVVMGDVAGHSPKETAQADHMRDLLSNCLALGLSPAATLQKVNTLLEPDPHFDGFGTVFVGTVEAETGKLTYASGGHEPGLIAGSDADSSGRVEQLESTGPPVGALPPQLVCFEQQETTLPADATLLLYTDGVSEARPPHERQNWLGTERLIKILARFASLSPYRLVFELLKRVSLFCRGQFEDDISVMAIRREPPRSKVQS